MTNYHPLDLLQGYRLGSRQATVELQRTDVSGIHIEFDVFELVEDVKRQPGQAVILTGTAGDGKTYLAYRIIDALDLEQAAVHDAQADHLASDCACAVGERRIQRAPGVARSKVWHLS